MLAVEDVAAGFRSDRDLPLDGIGFVLESGESVSICGRSGSGKSTLLFVLAGLLMPVRGHVVLDGVDVYAQSERARSHWRRDQVGFVFQFGEMLPELNVVDNVALPLRLQGESRGRAADRARGMLAGFGLEQYATSDVRALSGGELQRAAIARALVHRPAMVLADEPTGALDEENSRAVLDALMDGCREHGAVLIVATHDPVVAESTRRVARLLDRRLVEATGAFGL